MNHRKPAPRTNGRGIVNRQLALLLFAVSLAGCRSNGFSYYTSPQVTGRVLAADTQQALANATVRRVVPQPYLGPDTQPKGGQLLMQPAGVRTDADGRFVLNAVRDLTVLHLFRSRGWSSVTVSFERGGYQSFQTNFTAAGSTESSPEGAPLVNAGSILLEPESR